MTRPDALSDEALGRALEDVGRRLAYPDGASLAARVRERVAAERARPERPRPRSWLLALAPAALTLVVLSAGAYATDALRLRGAEIVRGPLPSDAGGALELGPRVASLDEAARLAGFRPPVPERLGAPDQIHVRTFPGRGTQVALVYGPRPGLPPAARSGVGALVIAVRGTVETPLLSKVAGPGTTVETLTVAGGRGVWLAGAPHALFYRTAAGLIAEDNVRLAGNVLLWEQGDLLLRVEARIGRAAALEIAGSAR